MLKKIRVDQLRLGMHLKEFCGSWMEHPFWRTAFVITDPKDIEAIQASSIREVWIDVSKGDDVEAELTVLATEAESQQRIDDELEHLVAPTPPPRPVSLSEEMQRARKVYAKSKEAVSSMFQEARMGRAIDAEKVKEVVEEISASVMRNPAALISLARLKNADEYTYMHSVAVCALMIALARQLELSPELTREAGVAGLLHDLGKAKIPLEILNKPGRLTEQEFRLMKEHPAIGHRLLIEGYKVGEIALDVCLHHHEKTDGTGYPEGLKDDAISLYAKMGAVCDVYDAITSNRPYKEGWNPAESLRKMAEWSKGHFDEQIFHAFVKSVGIYPIGSLVRMESGRLGVVVEQHPKSLLTPRIKLFFSTKSKHFFPPETIDLSLPSNKDKIVGREEASTWGISVNKVNEMWSAQSIAT